MLIEIRQESTMLYAICGEHPMLEHSPAWPSTDLGGACVFCLIAEQQGTIEGLLEQLNTAADAEMMQQAVIEDVSIELMEAYAASERLRQKCDKWQDLWALRGATIKRLSGALQKVAWDQPWTSSTPEQCREHRAVARAALIDTN